MRGERYGGRPIYFSDVIVRRDSPFHRFADLRGRSWSFNETTSHSGYGVTLARLASLSIQEPFFGQVVCAGAHRASIRLVAGGKVDASAIDSVVLAYELRDHPDLAEQLRVIDAFGPSTIQPLVVARHVEPALTKAIVAALTNWRALEADLREAFAYNLVERFAPVNDASYDDIRHMERAWRHAGVTTVR